MTPYLASAGWYAEWLRAMSAGMTDMEACSFASKALCLSGKDFARCRIVGNGAEMMLSIPVEGGASRLKRLSGATAVSQASILISGHGNWRHAHIGALRAAYGRTPYFPHLMPILEEEYNSGEKSLEAFNKMTHMAVVKMMFGDDTPANLLNAVNGNKHFLDRGKELAMSVSPGISVVDLLMHHGKESLLPLLATLPSQLSTLPSQLSTLPSKLSTLNK